MDYLIERHNMQFLAFLLGVCYCGGTWALPLAVPNESHLTRQSLAGEDRKSIPAQPAVSPSSFSENLDQRARSSDVLKNRPDTSEDHSNTIDRKSNTGDKPPFLDPTKPDNKDARKNVAAAFDDKHPKKEWKKGGTEFSDERKPESRDTQDYHEKLSGDDTGTFDDKTDGHGNVFSVGDRMQNGRLGEKYDVGPGMRAYDTRPALDIRTGRDSNGVRTHWKQFRNHCLMQASTAAIKPAVSAQSAYFTIHAVDARRLKIHFGEGTSTGWVGGILALPEPRKRISKNLTS